MAQHMTYDQYVDYLCGLRNLTQDQLFAWMKEEGRKIKSCDDRCEYENCHGWVCARPLTPNSPARHV